MSTPEKYFINQLRSHHCQLPPSDDYEYMKQVNKVKKVFLISEKSLLSYLKAKSLSAIYYEKRRQIRMTRILVIHPYSEFRRVWQFWICFILLLSMFMYPFASAFHGPFYARCLYAYHKPFYSFYLILYFVFTIQIFCLIDIVINFFSGYVNSRTDEMVIQPSRMARYYLRTYFFLDLLSSLPLDFVVVMVKGVRAYSQLSLVPALILTLLPLLKIFRLPALYKYFYSIYGCFSFSYNIYKMVAATGLYFLIIHWGGCFNVFIPQLLYYHDFFSSDSEKGASKTSWMRLNHLLEEDLFTQYIEAIYRCLSYMVGIGFEIRRLINIEDKIVSVILGIIGKIYWILLLVIFLQMSSTLKTGKVKYLEIMDQVEEYMNQKKFPESLKKKVREYYIYMFRKEYIGERSILKLLSDSLQQDILLTMHRGLIEKVQMFSGLSPTLLFNIVSCLKPEIYLTNDVVFKVGDVGLYMYFISFGTVAVYSENGKELDHLDDGEYFGEVSLILNVRRMVTIVAIETTELYRLSVQDFTEKIKPYPTYLKMEKLAMERVKKNARNMETTADSWTNKNYNSKKVEDKNVDEDEEDDDDDDDDGFFKDEEDDEDFDEGFKKQYPRG